MYFGSKLTYLALTIQVNTA